MKICAWLGRYGGLEDLVSLAVEHDELRTLSRVLHSAGPRGKTALLQLCEKMKTAADDNTASKLLQENQMGSERGVEEENIAFQGMTAEHLYHLLYRSYLSLSMSDAAGKTPYPCAGFSAREA